MAAQTTTKYQLPEYDTVRYGAMSRVVLQLQNHKQLLKLDPEPPKKESWAQLLLKPHDPDGTRFLFWDATAHTVRGGDYPELKLIDNKMYHISAAVYGGYDLERIIPITEPCPNCDRGNAKAPYPELKVTIRHFVCMMTHLVESIQLMDKHRVRHNDLTLRNILVDPTPTELKECLLQHTMPRIIDFGLASPGVDIDNSFPSFLTGCRHGLAYVENPAHLWPMGWVDKVDRPDMAKLLLPFYEADRNGIVRPRHLSLDECLTVFRRPTVEE